MKYIWSWKYLKTEVDLLFFKLKSWHRPCANSLNAFSPLQLSALLYLNVKTSLNIPFQFRVQSKHPKTSPRPKKPGAILSIYTWQAKMPQWRRSSGALPRTFRWWVVTCTPTTVSTARNCNWPLGSLLTLHSSSKSPILLRRISFLWPNLK